jgi:DNA-directed RNA polymerase subunit RPC12/RpoP
MKKKNFKCEFCKNAFSTKTNLNYHKKTANYCLKLRNKEHKEKYKCSICDKEYALKDSYNKHYIRCSSHPVITKYRNLYILKSNEVENLEKEKIRKDMIILNHKKNIKELKENIRNLQKQLENVAIKAVSRPTHTSNKTIQINNYIKQMEPLRIDRIKENVPMLTLDHHVKGPEGYAEYALEFPFKDRIVCVDVARNKIKYKNEEGDIIEDPGFRKMMLKLCDALKDRSYKLCQDHYEKLLDKFSEEEMDNTDFDFMEAAKAIHKYANGRESDFCSKIIKLISKGSKVN